MELCIRSKSGRLVRWEKVGIGAVLGWDIACDIISAHRDTREGSFDASALQSSLCISRKLAEKEWSSVQVLLHKLYRSCLRIVLSSVPACWYRSRK